jgi:hypothetical protein
MHPSFTSGKQNNKFNSHQTTLESSRLHLRRCSFDQPGKHFRIYGYNERDKYNCPRIFHRQSNFSYFKSV